MLQSLAENGGDSEAGKICSCNKKTKATVLNETDEDEMVLVFALSSQGHHRCRSLAHSIPLFEGMVSEQDEGENGVVFSILLS